MSGFDVSISTAVKRFRSKIDFLQPMLEAISNSLEAHATKIHVKLLIDDNPTLTDECTKKICGYEIKDNGDGFTEKNLNSFLTYMSDYKFDLGCKGIGRITWLKVFNNVFVKSISGQKSIEFQFNESFDRDKIAKKDISKRVQAETSVIFKDVRKSYFEQGKIDLRPEANIIQIRDVVEDHFLVRLSLAKASGNQFLIEFSMGSNESSRICNDSLIDLSEKDFCIKDAEGKCNLFKIYYSFFDGPSKPKRAVFFCADGRAVKPIQEKFSFGTLPDNKSSILFLTGEYLDERVNEERTEFNIADSRPSIDGGLYWDVIGSCLQRQVEEVLLAFFPNLETDNEQNIKDLIDEYPYLAKYILKDTSKIKDKEKILRQSKKLYEQEKEETSNKFKALLGKNNLDSDVFFQTIDDIQDISARELAEYIVYRKQIITALKRMNEENEKKESLLHNLLMRMRTDSSADSHEVYDNNLWLLDDKYMTYVYAASDITVGKIKKAIENESQELFNVAVRPDLAIFYSNNAVNKMRDVVVVEFKACGASLDEKSKSFWEITRNVEAIRENIEKIDRVWAYTITKFDDKFKKNIKVQDFSPLFSNGCKEEAYYRYYKTINAHCYYISIEAILSDAEARNNVFLEIIKKS